MNTKVTEKLDSFENSEQISAATSKRQSLAGDKENMLPSQEFVKPEAQKRQSLAPQPIVEKPVEYKENKNLDLEFKRKSFASFAYTTAEPISRANSRFSDSQVLRASLRSSNILNKKTEEQLPDFSESVIPPVSQTQDNFCQSQELPETQTLMGQSTLVDSINNTETKKSSGSFRRFFIRLVIGLTLGLVAFFAFSFINGTYISNPELPISDPQQDQIRSLARREFENIKEELELKKQISVDEIRANILERYGQDVWNYIVEYQGQENSISVSKTFVSEGKLEEFWIIN